MQIKSIIMDTDNLK